jgi:hypothetical protein
VCQYSFIPGNNWLLAHESSIIINHQLYHSITWSLLWVILMIMSYSSVSYLWLSQCLILYNTQRIWLDTGSVYCINLNKIKEHDRHFTSFRLKCCFGRCYCGLETTLCYDSLCTRVYYLQTSLSHTLGLSHLSMLLNISGFCWIMFIEL